MLQTITPPAAHTSSNYTRIARAISFLSNRYADQPSLEEAAKAAGLSPFHFQREFTKLAGVSPKTFVAHLTLERAKANLAKGETVLRSALDAGLSGPSRLHDLFLKVEAMTPGTYARSGEGLIIAYGFHPSLFGSALLMATGKGLCALAFGNDGEEEAMFADMASRWPKALFVHDQNAIAPYAERIFADSPRGKALPVQLFGTPWQVKVWQALLAIPEGEVATYHAVAETVCTPKAARATGAAIGRNPIALLIPCHRVLAANGALTGYHWGESRKRAMLALEAARVA